MPERCWTCGKDCGSGSLRMFRERLLPNGNTERILWCSYCSEGCFASKDAAVAKARERCAVEVESIPVYQFYPFAKPSSVDPESPPIWFADDLKECLRRCAQKLRALDPTPAPEKVCEDEPQPGDPVWSGTCPHCEKQFSVEVGDDEGEFSILFNDAGTSSRRGKK